MEIRTEDGTLLEVKEPIVLGKDGEVIVEPNSTTKDSFTSSPSFKAFSFSLNSSSWMKPLSLLLGLSLIIGLFTVGTVIFGLIAAFIFGLALLRSLFRLIGFKN